MGTSDRTPPNGAKAVLATGDRHRAAKPTEQSAPLDEPVVTEMSLGGGVPRAEPAELAAPSGDLYIRLEGRIYGPFRPPEMEELLKSGNLTGLEAASSDLHRWTPLAYHPRIVRRRVRDFDKAHEALREMSALPAKKEPDADVPLAAIVRRPRRASESKRSASGEAAPSRDALDDSAPGADET